MAGHRQGRERRHIRRRETYLEQLQRAVTAEEQLSIAFDWFRSAAYRHHDRQAELNAMASTLATQAANLDRSAHATGR